MDAINGIPIYSLTIQQLAEDYGVSVMSLVSNPASEKAFLALTAQQKQPIKLSFNEEQRVVTGVMLRADHPIYRKDEKTGKEYYFTISAEVMRSIVLKFMRDKNTDSVNIEHDGDDKVTNVFLFESFILTEQRKAGFPEFDDIEPGSWMVSYKIDNELVWNEVKLGKLKGFSPELIGDLNRTPDTEVLEQLNIISLIDEIEKHENDYKS